MEAQPQSLPPEVRTPLPKAWELIGVGLIGIIAGIFAIAWPGVTLLALGLILGIYLLLWGVGTLVSSFDERNSTADAVFGVALGFFGTIAGLICIVRPGTSVLAILLAVAFWLMITGIGDIVRGLTHRRFRAWNLVFGTLLLAGGIVIVSNPGIGMQTLALLAGISFIIRGIADVAIGYLVRQLAG